MKKILIITLFISLVGGCAERNEYKEVVLQQLKNDKDVSDYKIDPKTMADCVVDLSSKNMPGLFPLDPDRMAAYQNYAHMLTLMDADDPKKTLEELRAKFGSGKELAEAKGNYTQSYMDCIAALVNRN